MHQLLAGGRIIILEVEEIPAVKLSGKTFIYFIYYEIVVKHKMIYKNRIKPK
jgi:hypothetical protein